MQSEQADSRATTARMLALPPLVVARFWSKVAVGSSADCWEWKGHHVPGGYGQFRTGAAGSKRLLSHRVAWIIVHGEPESGLLVLHRCDNPPCVNPDHLFLGTAQDNSDDMVRKGRGYWQRRQRAYAEEGA